MPFYNLFKKRDVNTALKALHFFNNIKIAIVWIFKLYIYDIFNDNIFLFTKERMR